MNTTTVICLRSRGTRSKCGKKCYCSYEEAAESARYELNRPGFRGERVRIYGCKECHAYHLTTRPRSGKGEWFQRGK